MWTWSIRNVFELIRGTWEHPEPSGCSGCSLVSPLQRSDPHCDPSRGSGSGYRWMSVDLEKVEQLKMESLQKEDQGETRSN